MDPRRSATVAAALYPAAVLAGWAFISFAGHAPHRIEAARAAQVVDRFAPSLAANVNFAAAQPALAAPPKITESFTSAPEADVASAAERLAEVPAVSRPAPPEPKPVVVAALGDPSEIFPQPSMTAPGAVAADPAQDMPAAYTRLEITDECLVAEACIDQFLWALYERTPKEDTIKETERRKVQVKRKGKLVTVTRSFTKLVDNDFTWKDPKAAERAGMSMIDYVIGGMDKRFKMKLFYMLYAAEQAGLQPGITSAFRDDYRQSIASGLKAASDRSFHGGSFRGGYGHGLAADIVSVNGNSRAKRWISTEALWKWVDANGKDYGIGRPYLGRDPPHVGPIDGQEFVSRRGGSKTADARKQGKQAAEKPAVRKRPVAAGSSKGRST
jgi:hypothetical protein